MSLPVNIESLLCVIRDIGSTVIAQTSTKEVAGMVAQKFIETLGAKGATIILQDPQRNNLITELHLDYGFKPPERGTEFWKSRSLQLSQTDSSVLYSEIDGVSEPKMAVEENQDINILDLPLRCQDGLVGFIRLYFDCPIEFDEKDRNTIKIMVHQGSCAIEKSELIQRQQSNYNQLAASIEKMSALGRLSAGVAHEINNPLAGILLFSTNLLKKTPPESKFRYGLEVIIQETLRCKKIIQELLDFSREKEPIRLNVNLNEIITKSLVIIENECHLQHVILEKKLAEDLPESVFDPNQMEQVVINLLLNSVQAVEEGGRICIESRIREKGDRLELIISDNGCGIEPQNLSKVFDPFYSNKPQGTGLGLAVSYGIVRNHNGNIRVSSIPGEGTVFTVDFPLINSSAE